MSMFLRMSATSSSGHITSIAQLEALLLLWRDPEVTWGVPSMARRLYISKRQTIAILAQLKADGLIVVDETAQVRGIEPQHQELVGRLAEAYATQLIPIVTLSCAYRSRPAAPKACSRCGISIRSVAS
jgi:hypothetical protein